MNTVLRAVIRATVYRALAGRSSRFVLLLGGIALGAFLLANGVQAATYESSCPVDASTPPVQTDPVCERLTVLVAAVEALPQTDAEYDYAAVLSAIETNTASGGGTTEVAGIVSLSADDADRLDLIWVGIWMLAGLTLGTWFATRVWGEFRQWFHA